jgi:hypothetical protein
MLDPVLGHVAFYITLYAAVAASSLIAGLAPSILTAEPKGRSRIL